MIYVVHHNDPDGRFSAIAVTQTDVDMKTGKLSKRDGRLVSRRDMVYVESNYDTYKHFEVTKDDIVFIVDFSVPEKDLKDFIAKAGRVYWFDHHRSAIETFIKLRPTLDMNVLSFSLYEGFSGCELSALAREGLLLDPEVTYDISTFEYYTERIHPAYRMVGDYDVWRLQIPESKSFIAGLAFEDTNVNPECIKKFYSRLLSTPSSWEVMKAEISDFGDLITYIKSKKNTSDVKNSSYEGILTDGVRTYNTLFLNTTEPGSDVFQSVHNRHNYACEVTCKFTILKNRISCSIYRYTKVDGQVPVSCTDIAKHYGGGGHPGASGFTLPLEAKSFETLAEKKWGSL